MVTKDSKSVNRKTKQDDRLESESAWLNRAARVLARTGVANAGWESAYLLAHVLKTTPGRLALGADRPLSPARRRRADALLGARARRIPLQYVLGDEYFGGLHIRVGPGVLIPRPETNLLFESALARIAGPRNGPVADLGTGSGALALAMAAARTGVEIYGTDLSAQALLWARRNRKALHLHRVRFYHGDGVAPLPKRLWGTFQMVLTNPPYVPSSEIRRLQPEVRREPRLALDGGPDGLQGIRRMTEGAAGILKPRGWMLCEIGIHQAGQTRSIFQACGFRIESIVKDWQGIERILIGVKK